DGLPVADVGRAVRITPTEVNGEPVEVVLHRPVGAEQGAAHVVVDTDDVQAQIGEVAGGLRSDQSTGAGDQRDAHGFHPGSQCWAYQATVSAMPSCSGLRSFGTMPIGASVSGSQVMNEPGVSPGRIGRCVISDRWPPVCLAASATTSSATSMTMVWSTGPH